MHGNGWAGVDEGGDMHCSARMEEMEEDEEEGEEEQVVYECVNICYRNSDRCRNRQPPPRLGVGGAQYDVRLLLPSPILRVGVIFTNERYNCALSLDIASLVLSAAR